jgi:hypothetical protein
MLVHKKDGSYLSLPVSSIDSVSYVTAYDLAPYIVTLNMNSTVMKIGETINIEATITKNSTIINNSVTWSTSDNSVAKVSIDGEVIAIGVGSCDIIATYKNISAKCHIEVLSSAIINDLIIYQAYADSIDYTSIDINAQIEGLSALEEGSYSIYFYYSTTEEELGVSNGTKVRATLNSDNIASYRLENMNMGSTYYFCLIIATFDGKIYYGPSNSYIVKDIITKGDKIDIGIPGLLIGSCNLGADSPEKKGNLYAWGETETKSRYSSNNYVYYNSNWDIWKGLGDDISGTQYDVAKAVLGEGWHIPDKVILEKMLSLLTWKHITYKGVSGYLVVGFNKNCLFIPDGGVWTASSSSTNEQKALSLKDMSLNEDDRYSGLYIRPVFGRIDYPVEFVDLGLSVKWATCNIKACRPEDYGEYYSWGEIETKYPIWSSNYKYANGSATTALTKYCYNSSYGNNGFADYKTILDAEDDVANVLWGGDWFIPTIDEINELISNCTLTWTTVNGINGYKVTSNIPGYTQSSIFLPAAGSRYGYNTDFLNKNGAYWSSSLSTDNPSLSFGFNFNNNDFAIYSNSRELAFSVRPVCPSVSWKNDFSITINVKNFKK